MLFNKSKKKRLAEIKFQLYLLRDGLGVQKENAVHLAETYSNKETFAQSIDKIYEYMIAKVKEIEKI